MPATPEAWLRYGLLLLLLVLIIVVLIQLIFYLRRANRGDDRRTARQILDERYARGEIDRDQYEQMRRDLD